MTEIYLHIVARMATAEYVCKSQSCMVFFDH
eukprot:COSAG05_NODE_2735_length_2712_cov_2.337543_1_plen_30_part_10